MSITSGDTSELRELPVLAEDKLTELERKCHVENGLCKDAVIALFHVATNLLEAKYDTRKYINLAREYKQLIDMQGGPMDSE
jgi:hypothetical protein